ncbi:spondin domain-containing protein [Leptothoe kymatousa]|uniref:PEP-CTERM sorting domain-containing protein n=1 Tax=Leptothoe kymatousa TAU-MAC 1615 TaxID=2364775 RepID=A0ABS5Y2Q4_9CYAN|nr:spondin domain-containing protein [Leptothoe kymatousa]MBT9312123.1 PEP-CTERM sorting domain-containing protein [Leptothoe kymatousa TAU-MAC 1615]
MNKCAVGSRRVALAAVMALGSVTTMATAASAATLRVTIDNLAPTNGSLLTPAWVGFHDGSFDLYDLGESLDGFPGVEALVEDGNNAPLTDAFAASNPGGVQATLLSDGPPPLEIGESTSFLLDVDASNRYFSYASMVLPSNDAFIANGNPLAHQIFDDAGNFLGADFVVLGSEVNDGGTEVNDELASSTAFLGQSAPNTGTDENGVVTLHPGFIPGGRILSTTDSSAFNGLPLNFTGADFTGSGYQVARFRVELVDDAADVPEPGALVGLLAVGGLVAANRKRKQAV